MPAAAGRRGSHRAFGPPPAGRPTATSLPRSGSRRRQQGPDAAELRCGGAACTPFGLRSWPHPRCRRGWRRLWRHTSQVTTPPRIAGGVVVCIDARPGASLVAAGPAARVGRRPAGVKAPPLGSRARGASSRCATRCRARASAGAIRAGRARRARRRGSSYPRERTRSNLRWAELTAQSCSHLCSDGHVAGRRPRPTGDKVDRLKKEPSTVGPALFAGSGVAMLKARIATAPVVAAALSILFAALVADHRGGDR